MNQCYPIFCVPTALKVILFFLIQVRTLSAEIGIVCLQ